jgi:hypothetical protein
MWVLMLTASFPIRCGKIKEWAIQKKEERNLDMFKARSFKHQGILAYPSNFQPSLFHLSSINGSV